MKRFLPFLWLRAIAALWLLVAAWSASAQAVGAWPIYTPPPPFVQGPTLGATLFNAAQVTSDQARVTAQAALEMGRRARGDLQMLYFSNDYQNLQLQFQNLRATFNQLAGLVPQLQSARAANAVAELDAGLNIIAEAFTPVQQEIQAGMLNRDTVVRMCQLLKETLDLWQRELKKDSARLGMIR
jgi:hypothetical protein